MEPLNVFVLSNLLPILKGVDVVVRLRELIVPEVELIGASTLFMKIFLLVAAEPPSYVPTTCTHLPLRLDALNVISLLQKYQYTLSFENRITEVP